MKDGEPPERLPLLHERGWRKTMPVELSGSEAAQLEAMLETSENNLRALEWFSGYLNLCPRFVSGEDVALLSGECGVSGEEAYRLLMASACGLDLESDPWAREMARRYFQPGVRQLDAAACREDPYYAAVRLPQARRGRWTLGYKRIEPYEAFASGDLLLMPDGREVPQAGYFTEPFLTPVVMEDGREWMTVTPSELSTMTADIQSVSGRVAVFGLGLGYYAFMTARRAEVERVTVIERDAEVIALFREHILPAFENPGKVDIVQADAYEYAARMGGEGYDFAYVDIWHDVLDGVEMYLKMKRLEALSPGTRFLYWIETSILCWLRGMALMEIAERKDGPMLEAIGPVKCLDDLKRALSQEGLRRLAPRIPLEVAHRE